MKVTGVSDESYRPVTSSVHHTRLDYGYEYVYNVHHTQQKEHDMVNAVVPLGDEKPNTFGWLQLEKKAAGELSKLAIKSPAAMGTLMYLINHMSRSNALVVSQTAIAKGIGLQRKTVNIAVQLLEKHQFIEIIKVGSANIYRVNNRVVWQGERGKRYTSFNAEILAFEDEQISSIDDRENLKSVPFLNSNERVYVQNNEIDPPDQQELDLP